MEEHQKRIGQRIAKRRVELGLTQEQAQRLVGVKSIRTYQKWEHGESNPYPRNWAKIAEAFGTTREELEGRPPADVEELEDQLDRIEAKIDALTAGLAKRPAEQLRERLEEIARRAQEQADGKREDPPGLEETG